MDIAIPAAFTGSTETAASPVTTQTSVEQHEPQADTPAGSSPQANSQDGIATEDTASPDQASQENPDKKTWKERQKERNRERWQDYKAGKAYRDLTIANLQAEVHRLKSQPPPDVSQFTDADEALAARVDYRAQQREAERAEGQLQRERQIAARAAQDAMAAKWDATTEDMRARMPDFDDVFTIRTPIHERATPYIIESEKGGEIAYFLGKNPQVAEELYAKFQTAPAQALIELGRIEARLMTPLAKTTSTAPKPATTLNGGVNPLAFDAQKSSVNDMSGYLKRAGIIR